MELFYRFSKVVVVAGLIIGISMPAAEAYQVYGAIGEKWRQLGAETGPLGAPSSDERDAARGGRFNEFQHGFIYWNGRDGAHAVYGTIGEKWKQLGRETGALGYPLTDELPGTNGGRFNIFESGVIYWRPNYGAYAVYGHIGEKWIALGRESGICGYPTSDEYDFDDNRYTGEYGIGKRFRRSDFTNGYILWSKHRDQTYVSCSGASSNPPPTSAPRISVEFDRFFGQSLGEFRISGSGFRPNSQVTIKITSRSSSGPSSGGSSTSNTPTNADSSGNISLTLSVFCGAGTTHEFTAIDASGNTSSTVGRSCP